MSLFDGNIEIRVSIADMLNQLRARVGNPSGSKTEDKSVPDDLRSDSMVLHKSFEVDPLISRLKKGGFADENGKLTEKVNPYKIAEILPPNVNRATVILSNTLNGSRIPLGVPIPIVRENGTFVFDGKYRGLSHYSSGWVRIYEGDIIQTTQRVEDSATTRATITNTKPKTVAEVRSDKMSVESNGLSYDEGPQSTSESLGDYARIYETYLGRISPEMRRELEKVYRPVEYSVYANPQERESRIVEGGAEAIRLTQKTGKRHIFDVSTGNILNPRGAQNVCLKEPLVSFHIPGRDKPVILRQSIAYLFMAADHDRYKALGSHFQLAHEGGDVGRPHTRTNKYQGEASARYKSGGGLAGSSYGSRHLSGCAIDITNWEEGAPYLRYYGFVVGYQNGLRRDAVHADFGRVTTKRVVALEKLNHQAIVASREQLNRHDGERVASAERF